MKKVTLKNVKPIVVQDNRNVERIKTIIRRLQALEKEAFECGLHSAALMIQASAIYVDIEAFDTEE